MIGKQKIADAGVPYNYQVLKGESYGKKNYQLFDCGMHDL